MVALHEHSFEVYAERSNGDFHQVWSSCECGIGERRRYINGRLYEIRLKVRPYGEWIDPLELLSTALTARLKICPTCRGLDPRCPACHALGVLDSSGAALR